MTFGLKFADRSYFISPTMRWSCLFPVIFCLMIGKQIFADELKQYQKSWTYQALILQQNMTMDTVLSQVMIPHTHNSYNSKAYANGLHYLDPNQVETITRQLEMGFRSVEFDVHYSLKTAGWPWQWGKELVLCHGTDNHTGCGTRDRRFIEGLAEIAEFLERSENRLELIILYIEDHMDGQYSKAIAAIEATIGDKVFRPQGGACQGIPMAVTKRQILATGKQIIIMGGREVCASQSGWDAWAFGGVGSYLNGSYPSANFSLYQDGQCERQFSRDYYQKFWVRVQEDRTNLTKLVNQSATRLGPKDVKILVDCGVNLVGLDKVKIGDPRLDALIWSWAPGKPAIASGRNCGAQQLDGRIGDYDCDEPRAFACKSADHEWYITSSQGHWAEGELSCLDETAGEYRFAVPVNGYDSQQLKQLKDHHGESGLWLNYQDITGLGDWQVN